MCAAGSRSFWDKCLGLVKSFLGNYDEPRGEVGTTCCSHAECEGSRLSWTCRRVYRLAFVTTKPLGENGRFVHRRLRSFYPNQEIKESFVVNYTKRTKWGFYLC